jgi:hypothetical protein
VAGKLKELLECNSPLSDNKPDNYIRHKTVETLIRVFDANPPQKIEVDKTSTTQVIISNDVVARLEKYQKMRELTRDAETGIYAERPQE